MRAGSGRLSTAGHLPAACFNTPPLSAPVFLPDASRSFGAPQAAVYLPASTSVHPGSNRRRLLHRAADLPLRIRRCFASVPLPSTSCVQRAPQRAGAVHSRPSGLLHLASALRSAFTDSCVREVRSPQTASQLAASTSRARAMPAEYLVGESGSRAGSLRDCRHKAGSQR
jgi:hypothetical protein